MPTIAENDPAQQQAQEYREALQDAYAFVEGQKAAQSFAAYTVEDCYADYVERVSGKGTQSRPNQLERIERERQRVLAAIERVRVVPPDDFRAPDPENDVNTPV